MAFAPRKCDSLTLALFMTGIVTMQGCAWNESGLVRVQRFENASTYVVRLDSLGVHVITNTIDAGIYMGRTQKIYVLPKHNNAASPGLCVPASPSTGMGLGRRIFSSLQTL